MGSPRVGSTTSPTGSGQRWAIQLVITCSRTIVISRKPLRRSRAVLFRVQTVPPLVARLAQTRRAAMCRQAPPSRSVVENVDRISFADWPALLFVRFYESGEDIETIRFR